MPQTVKKRTTTTRRANVDKKKSRGLLGRMKRRPYTIRRNSKSRSSRSSKTPTEDEFYELFRNGTVDVNSYSSGKSILCHAIVTAREDGTGQIQRLIDEFHVDVNQPTHEGKPGSPLFLAVSLGLQDVYDILKKAGAVFTDAEKNDETTALADDNGITM